MVFSFENNRKGGGKMRKLLTGILMAILFCFPYVYFSMYQDFVNRSMNGYFIMIVVTSLLGFLSKFLSNLIPIIIGNIISGFVSYYFIIKMSGIGNWDFYFKPLTPSGLLMLVSVLNLLPQFLAIKVAKGLKKQ